MFSEKLKKKKSIMRLSLWDKEISSSGMNILIRDSTSLVNDKNIHPSEKIFVSHMNSISKIWGNIIYHKMLT